MTFVSNDPTYWLDISLNIFLSYWTVAALVVVVYDWVLTLGQEIELIWRKRWSLMTVLYLIIRYIGIPFSVTNILGMPHALPVFHFSDQRHTENMASVSLTDAVSILHPSHSYAINTLICVSTITNHAVNGTNVALTTMLGVIMISRLHAMYQESRAMLIFLVIIFLAVNIACAVIMVIALKYLVGGELIISGAHMCSYELEGNDPLLISMISVLNSVWEVLVLCLSVWIAVKHFRDMRRLGLSTGSKIVDCFKVLIQSHVLYFASFVGVSCIQLVYLSPNLNANSIGDQVLDGAVQILSVVQMFVLGPRLILSVREYHAELVECSDAEITMNTIIFLEHVHVSTSSTV
ncbi:uncharacterized protein HD556DRAFT_1451473 [Suillus plorans]|uniref:DUF6533 domain-containing protein n=1 Tax=Suillus plorans TaxID=116603 RepID=A0A9P7DA74_9AGAM|nr:uncharacterized protein HD556DRAFT_1451473 [Suillus plorans]KAG1784727.1 hypothetical protein HD556DRAFT_1451473 [Suillus plorans]